MRYRGPADVFYLVAGGKAYRRGEDVPISKEQARHLGRAQHGGHRFEDVPAETRPARAEPAPASESSS